jgi:hypothetical protein
VSSAAIRAGADSPTFGRLPPVALHESCAATDARCALSERCDTAVTPRIVRQREAPRELMCSATCVKHVARAGKRSRARAAAQQTTPKFKRFTASSPLRMRRCTSRAARATIGPNSSSRAHVCARCSASVRCSCCRFDSRHSAAESCVSQVVTHPLLHVLSRFVYFDSLQVADTSLIVQRRMNAARYIDGTFGSLSEARASDGARPSWHATKFGTRLASPATKSVRDL